MIPELRKSSFYYHLPEEYISQHALEARDNAKLLVYDTQQQINHHIFNELPNILKQGDALILNNTKVIPARIQLKKSTGAQIEVFLLTTIDPSSIEKAMDSKGPLVWKTMIRNLKKWKDGEKLYKKINVSNEQVIIDFEIIDRTLGHVKLSWDKEINFSEIIQSLGQLPLPPYIKRLDKPTEQDAIKYQTVYAHHPGAVAAPTAGLHFTNNILKAIESKGVKSISITLHVGAGTFVPLRDELISQHKMHCESFAVTKECIEQYQISKGKIIAVGTTSVRALESLYWIGFQLYYNDFKDSSLYIPKAVPYQHAGKSNDFSIENALDVILEYMNKINSNTMHGETEIMIVPGYKFKTIDAILTNFHLPESTLIMLIAAWIGEDWKRVYGAAIDHDYRFLSFGDSSLLYKRK